MKNFVEALDAISTQVWAAIFILGAVGLLMTAKGQHPGEMLLGAGLTIFKLPSTDKGADEKTQ